jgi:hypothetical protein
MSAVATNIWSPQGPADIVNRATVLIGGLNNQPAVVGTPPNFDGSPIGIAAGIAYGGVIQTINKQYGYDFSRYEMALTLSGNTPPWGFTQEYLYPTNGVEVRQVMLSAAAQAAGDPNDPLPVLWNIGFNQVGGIPTKVIWTDVPSAYAVVSGQPPEALWDALYTEAVVRLLAAELDMAIAARPDSANIEMERMGLFQQVSMTREG